MKYSASNIALNAYDHAEQLPKLVEMGLSGLEVAISRVWKETYQGLTSQDVKAYRKSVENAGLDIVGLHSLFFDQPDLGLFKERDIRDETLIFMVHLSTVCRDLGGKTLIYGSGRKRGELPLENAFHEAISFFEDLIPRIEGHGTVFCFEPLAPKDSDFVNSVYDSIRLVKEINHPSLKCQLDAKALVATGELTSQVFKDAAPYLVHVHANEFDLGVLDADGPIDHRYIGKSLNEIGYDGYVSIEQKMVDQEAPLAALSKSAAVLIDNYA